MSADTTGGTRAAERRVRQRFVEDHDHSHQVGSLDAQGRLEELLAQEAPLLSDRERERRAHELAVELVGLGPVQLLLDDPAVSDVLVNGPGEVWVERRGRLERSGIQVDERSLARSIERLVAPLGLRADRSQPIVDARLPDGTRVAVVLPPLAVDGPLLAVRRHLSRVVPLASFAGAAGDAGVALLRSIVRARLNVVVHGATGAGKTTLVNALAAHFSPQERVVTIEDVAELRLPGEHVVRLEARPGSADGVGRAELRDLVRVALRLRPDRIVVGEVRGPEALDMIWALSTGHTGCVSTCHARTAADALRRLETMAASGSAALPLAAVHAQVVAAVDVLVGVRRAEDGRREVVDVHRLDDDGVLHPWLHDGVLVQGAPVGRGDAADAASAA